MGLRVYVLAVVALGLASACDHLVDPARDLERRILAPCCYRQTLEDHESAIAQALRDDIARRLARGDAPAAIERELVARYGPEVVAAPPARWPVIVFLSAAIAVGLMVIARLVRRRRVGAGSAPPREPAPAHHDLADRDGDRLVDELAVTD